MVNETCNSTIQSHACSCTAKLKNPTQMPKKKKLAFLQETKSVPKTNGFGTDYTTRVNNIYILPLNITL